MILANGCNITKSEKSVILAADQNIFKLQLYNGLKVHTLSFNLRIFSITIGGKIKELQLFNTLYCQKYWHPLLMIRFDYFSHFYEYKS